jgi:hypothetical protein
VTKGWSGLGDCPTCGADPDQPCTGVGAKYSVLYPPVIKHPHKARTLAARIAHAEAMSARYLGNYNEAVAAGREQRAKKMLAKSQHWLDVANDLRGWGEITPVRRKKLTEDEWRKVFHLRCRSKQGQELSKEDRALVDAAYNEDPERYGAMEPDVFDATVPFGSTVRWKR